MNWPIENIKLTKRYETELIKEFLNMVYKPETEYRGTVLLIAYGDQFEDGVLKKNATVLTNLMVR